MLIETQSKYIHFKTLAINTIFIVSGF